MRRNPESPTRNGPDRSGRWASVLLYLYLLVVDPGCRAGVAADAPDIRSVPADLRVPELTDGPPAADRRVREKLPGSEMRQVYHVVYLPKNYQPGRHYPVLVEFPGNGGYRNKYGDVCNGLPDGCKLGYGISGGRDFVWVCLPFLSGSGDQIATRWWGSKPDYDVKPTVAYCRQVIQHVCRTHGGDSRRVVLTGFSRGSLAVNFVGLHNDKIARLWCGFVAYSHYDGTWPWDYPGSDRAAARSRLRRLGGRRQFICHEETGDASALEATRKWLLSDLPKARRQLTFSKTGFRNHSDAWVLRPSPARRKLRHWVREVVDLSNVQKPDAPDQ